jgi:putative ATP-dependent endonuclease of the OLD family
MKVRKLSIKNVTSYRERTDFGFEDRINILIGPNGGGKSNVQRILALVLSKYFILQYDFKYSDDERKIDPVEMWNRRVLERSLERFVGDPSDQEIEIELVPEAADIQNIKTIGENLHAFNEHLSDYEVQYTEYAPHAYVDQIAAAGSFAFKIRNFILDEPAKHTAAWAFKEYLREFFIFMRLSSRIPQLRLTSPVFFFFSERTFGRKLEVQTNQITEQNYFAGMRSASQAAMGDNTNLLQWGAQHFARLHWKAVNGAAHVRDRTAEDLFALEPDVKLLNKYMHQLGYQWSFLTDHDNVSFAFALRKDGHWFTVDKFSSGEKEIVHFLLALFALNVRDGLVLVDEPELHLHPRWQRIFLGLFRELSAERNDQFIIATHSPVFVSPDTINDIQRIYRRPNEGSTPLALRSVALPEKKNLVRMINSQNNERVFFADKVVLVEGITDRLVFASLLEGVTTRFGNNEAIEIVEVGGKHNFADYRSLLDSLQTKCFVIADRDYLTIVGSAETKALFATDSEAQWEALTKDKKSTDARAMMRALEDAVSVGNAATLKQFLEYLRSRHRRLKEPLGDGERTLVATDIQALAGTNVSLLRDGEIEHYLPDGVSDVRKVVEMTTDRDWINLVPDENKRIELGEIACHIVGVQHGSAERERFLEELRTRRVRFPSLAPAPAAPPWT